MMPATGTGTGRRLAPPAPARRHRPATAPAARTLATHGTAGHGHGKPATVETWQSAGTVAAGIKQKAGNP